MDAQTPIVLVTPDDQLADVLQRVVNAGGGGRTVDLVVPGNTGVLLTAGEFRELRATTDRYRVGLTLYSDDPFRRQLAPLMGIESRAIPVHIRRAVQGMMPPPEVVAWPDPLPPPPPPPTMPPPPRAAEAWPEEPAPFDGYLPDEREAEAEYDGSPRSRRAAKVLSVLGALIVVALLATGAFFALRPRALVQVSLEQIPVRTEATFDLTADGLPLDAERVIVLKAEPQVVTITTTVERPVTGIQLIPDQPATGRVVFANISPNSMSVPAGTRLESLGGQVFLLDEAVTVPPVDSVTGLAGNAEGTITAETGGSTGNVASGEVTGSVAPFVYYSNRNGPTTGGTDRETTVVSEADVSALQEAAAGDLASRAATEITTATPDGMILPSTIAVTSAKEDLSAQVGEEATTVTLTSTQDISVLTYEPAAVLAAVRNAVATELAGQVPPGFTLDPDRLAAIGDAVEVSGSPNGARFTVAFDGAAEASFGTAEQQSLATALAGMDEAAAQQVLDATPGISTAAIRLRPGWFARSLPSDPDRISFDIVP